MPTASPLAGIRPGDANGVIDGGDYVVCLTILMEKYEKFGRLLWVFKKNIS